MPESIKTILDASAGECPFICERTQGFASGERPILKTHREERDGVHEELSFYKHALDETAIVAVTDPAGTILFANEKFCQISGYDREELLGQNHRLVNSQYHPRSFFSGMYRTIAAGKIWRGEIRNRSKDGRFYWVDTTIIPTVDGAGKITRYVAIRADITERKNAETALAVERLAVESANRELAEKNRELSELYQTAQRFVDDISHEFRTPLSVIKGYSEIMRAGIAGSLNAEQRQYNQVIIERTRDMAQMVDDLLDSSKLRAGSLRVNRATCQVESIFSSIHSIIDGRIQNHRIQWVERVQPGLPNVFVDAEKAGRVLVNLVINAIKFSPEASRIELTAAEEANGDVRISVKDEGPGIGAENLAVIFERFKQVGTAMGSTKGFGLGLSIAKELVWLNLGRISVTSELGKGSVFSFTIPTDRPGAIVARLFDYLADRQTAPGSFAVLRVTPDGSEHRAAIGDLRSYIACLAHPGDVVIPSFDEKSLVIFGYSSKPWLWQARLSRVGQEIDRGPGQRIRAFKTKLVGNQAYPGPATDAEAMVRRELERTRGNE